jgi:4a-hydroxytetrahydrobiopterin dehydratase
MNWDTAHIIRGPESLKRLVGLQTKACTAAGAAARLPLVDAERLRNQVAGWRLDDSGGEARKLTRDWSAKDDGGASADALVARLAAVAAAEGHPVAAMRIVGGVRVEVELATVAAGGVTENDFILAAKLNAIDAADLSPPKRARFWA